MSDLRFFGKYFILTMGQLRQQGWLLAGLVLLCLLLPLGAGRAAGELLSRGVDFSPVTLAVSAPEGDQVPLQLEQFMGEMEDVAQYCRIVSMDEEAALAALARGEAAAVLDLPQDFIRGVMWGENPDLRLIVSGDRPLEALLLLWVGQSASDILSAFQSGVYAVLDLYEEAPPPGLTRDQVVFDINLRYISLALDRTGMFQTRELSATRTLPVPLHYALALLSYFALSAAPLFVPIYSGGWLRPQRRLRAAGRGVAVGYWAGVFAGAILLLPLLLPALLLAGGGPSLPLLGAALGMALFCSVFSSVCCLVSRSAAGCGLLAFTVSLAALALAGGIVPPVLLPGPVRGLRVLSPVSWLQRLAVGAVGRPPDPSAVLCLTASGAVLAVLALSLYRRRTDSGEVGL